jgi:putative redox protein
MQELSFMSGEWREVRTIWREDQIFIGINQAGAQIQIGSKENQPGVGPMEMLLFGLAGCTGMDIVSILSKKRQDLQKFEIEVRGKRAKEYPMVYTDIEVVYHFWGDHLDPRAVEQAIKLSEEKYCSVSIMLAKTANIKHEYVLYPPEGQSQV